MSTIALPTVSRAPMRRWVTWGIAPVVTLVAVAGYWGITRPVHTGPILADAKFDSVQPVDLDVKVKKDGELQSVNNIDVVCTVEGLNTITQIVKEGSFVKKGDVLVTLDSSAIREKIDDTEI